ncbi:hypothetical protein Droror1_Dr00018592 [Drosera rotundifolia]
MNSDSPIVTSKCSPPQTREIDFLFALIHIEVACWKSSSQSTLHPLFVVKSRRRPLFARIRIFCLDLVCISSSMQVGKTISNMCDFGNRFQSLFLLIGAICVLGCVDVVMGFVLRIVV